MVEPNRIDCGNGRLSIRVGGKQHLTRLRIFVAGFLKKLCAAHLRHPLIDEKKGYGVIALLERANRLQCLRARTCLQYSVVLAVVPREVSFDRVANLFFIVDR